MNPILIRLLNALSAFEQENYSSLEDLVDPNVVYRIPGRTAFSGDHVGFKAVVEALRDVRTRSEGTLSMEPGVFLTNGEHVMFSARVRAEKQGRRLDVTNIYSYRFVDDKLVEGRVFPGDLHAVEAFFGE